MDTLNRNAFELQSTSFDSLPLYHLASNLDFSHQIPSLCCNNGIASSGAFSLAMIADFKRVLKTEGAWAYRRLFWEAGMIGQVLYLEAEAAGLSGSAMGCFFDDAVHEVLGFESPDSSEWQSIYCFAVGGPLHDPTLSTEPPYSHLNDRTYTFLE